MSHEIKTGTAEAEDLTATIEKATSDIQTNTAKIEEITAAVSTAEADLKAATEIRDKEHEDFVKEEGELTKEIDIVTRAAGIIEKEMAKGASMLQLKSAKNMEQALAVLVQ